MKTAKTPLTIQCPTTGYTSKVEITYKFNVPIAHDKD